MQAMTKIFQFATTGIGAVLTAGMFASLQVMSGLLVPSLFWLFSGISYSFSLWMYFERQVSRSLGVLLCVISLVPVLVFGPSNPL
jgi:uncharacterized membrane protein